jgi:agmatinase
MRYVLANGLFDWASGSASLSRQGGIEVVGVPSDFGNTYVSGTRLGPTAIRRSSLRLPRPTVHGHDHGDIEVFDGADWVDIIERVRRSVSDIVAAGAFPLVLGGDHAVSYAVVSALDRIGPMDIVWFDAHTDFCRWEEADWHNHKQVLRRIAGLPYVERILVIGHRGVTYFDESQQWPTINVVGCPSQGQSMSIPDVWLRSERPLYLSIDIDVLDPCTAPGTGHPVPGGLDLETLCALIRTLSLDRRVVGADVMEVNPSLDYVEMTSMAAAKALSVLVNAVARQRSSAPADAASFTLSVS